MIVGKRDDGLLMVTQVAHARLAGQLARMWGNEHFETPQPRDAVSVAADLHDEGWAEPDKLPLYNERTRRPADFLEIDLREHAAFYKAGVEKVAATDAYAGLLASMHWTGLYRGRWGSAFGMVRRDLDQELQAFLDQVVREQELAWVDVKSALWDPSTRRGEFEERLWMNYDLLQALDVLSLLCCMCGTKRGVPENVLGAVPSTLHTERGSLRVNRINEETMAVSPWPLTAPEVELAVTGTVLEDRDYGSREEVLDSLSAVGEVKLPVRLIPGDA